MEMPKPTDSHRKLKMLEGTWHGEERLFPTPFDPNGGPAIGRVINRSALEGLAVVQEYEQERKGTINFRGHGVFTWDSSEKAYILYWIDSTGMSQNVFRGTFVDNTLTLMNKAPHGITRATWEFKNDREYFYWMEASGDGKEWLRVLEGTYKRIK